MHANHAFIMAFQFQSGGRVEISKNVRKTFRKQFTFSCGSKALRNEQFNSRRRVQSWPRLLGYPASRTDILRRLRSAHTSTQKSYYSSPHSAYNLRDVILQSHSSTAASTDGCVCTERQSRFIGKINFSSTPRPDFSPRNVE